MDGYQTIAISLGVVCAALFVAAAILVFKSKSLKGQAVDQSAKINVLTGDLAEVFASLAESEEKLREAQARLADFEGFPDITSAKAECNRIMLESEALTLTAKTEYTRIIDEAKALEVESRRRGFD